jgi:hypothetical protein
MQLARPYRKGLPNDATAKLVTETFLIIPLPPIMIFLATAVLQNQLALLVSCAYGACAG